jgi:hypothetical protein
MFVMAFLSILQIGSVGVLMIVSLASLLSLLVFLVLGCLDCQCLAAACIFWLVLLFFSIALGITQSIATGGNPGSSFQIFLSIVYVIECLVNCLFSTVVYWIIRQNVLDFMDIKASLGR